MLAHYGALYHIYILYAEYDVHSTNEFNRILWKLLAVAHFHYEFNEYTRIGTS